MTPLFAPWFPSAELALGTTRQPCLATLEAARLMGLTLLDPTTELTLDEEARQLACWTWLHTATPPEIGEALRTGSWYQATREPLVLDSIIAAWRLERAALLEQIAAATVTVRPRPRREGAEQTPADVIAPTLYVHRLLTIRAASGMPIPQIAWSLPIGQALQIYHWALWNDGCWTVRAGEKVTEADFADFDLGALTREE